MVDLKGSSKGKPFVLESNPCAPPGKQCGEVLGIRLSLASVFLRKGSARFVRYRPLRQPMWFCPPASVDVEQLRLFLQPSRAEPCLDKSEDCCRWQVGVGQRREATAAGRYGSSYCDVVVFACLPALTFPCPVVASCHLIGHAFGWRLEAKNTRCTQNNSTCL